jgi:5'-deoxynucleotidase YfbR-like HD superfamily hydrolase
MHDDPRGRPIATYSGGRLHPLDPLAEEISIEDIAHGLANTCRYGGQCRFYYSVGTHSLYVSRELSAEFGVETQLYGLFHDAAEAYVTDVPRPVKGELDGYDDIESQLLEAVWGRSDSTGRRPTSGQR